MHDGLAHSPPGVTGEAIESDRWLAPGALVAAIALGLALQISNGFLQPGAVGLIAIAFVLTLCAALLPRPQRFARLDAVVVPLIATAGLVAHLGYLFTSQPGIYLQVEEGGILPFLWGLSVLAVAGGTALWGAPRWAKPVHVCVLVVTHAAMGVWVLHRSPDPAIDVHMFQHYAAAALRSGANPYAMTFPDIYHNAALYGPGIAADGRLLFGFPYFPLSLLVAMPAYLLAGDTRYAQLAAIELAAVLMAFSRPGGFGVLAAVLYLTTPRTFFVLEQSWTEPFVVLGLAAVAFAACRRSRAVPWLFGAFIALKQYLVFALPAAVLLVARPSERRDLLTFLSKAAILAAGVTLPFFLWSPSAFWTSVVTLQFHQPFRLDALSFLSWWAARGHEQPSSLIAFVMAGLVSAVAVWRLPRTAAGFTIAVVVTFFAFFAFNKQAFCNYYFFVLGGLYVALAVGQAPATVELPMDEPLFRPEARRRLLAAAVALAVLIPVILPGDVPFINDEPLLIAAAVDANRAGHPATMGLQGTFDFIYGPAPVWIYQLLMALSHNLVLVAALHTLLVAATTAAALWWLSRSLRLWPWFIPLPLLSPYFWFYARVLWDNPFLLPLGALALAGYAAHLKSASTTGLRVSVAAAALCLLVHLMSLALVVPLVAHMLVVRRRSVWAHKYSLAAIGIVVLALAWPYWSYLAAHQAASTSGAGRDIHGWLFPLLGGRLLGAGKLAYFYGDGPASGWLFAALAVASSIAYPLVWIGMVVAAWYAGRAMFRREWTPRAHVAAIALAAVACQIVIDGVSAKYQHPHYQNGTWIVFVLLAWFAVDADLIRRRASRPLQLIATGLLAATNLMAVCVLAARLHDSGGTREVYGPTLGNQQQVARDMAQYAFASDVQSDVIMWERFPHTLTILRQLNASRRLDLPRRALAVRYTSSDPASGAIALVER